MSGEKKNISPEDLKNFLVILEGFVDDEVRAIESKAHVSSGAPQSYCDDMNGCARGKSIMGHDLIRKIRDKFL